MRRLRHPVLEVVAVLHREDRAQIGGVEKRVSRGPYLAVYAEPVGQGAQFLEPCDAQFPHRSSHQTRGVRSDGTGTLVELHLGRVAHAHPVSFTVGLNTQIFHKKRYPPFVNRDSQ